MAWLSSSVRRMGSGSSAPPADNPYFGRSQPQGAGNDVVAIQNQLAAAGANPGRIDGVWGPQTEAAYQQVYGAPSGRIASRGGGGGGGYAPAGGGAPPPGPAITGEPARDTALGADPAYLAYMRALGFEESEAERVTNDAVSRIQNRLATQIPEIQQAGGWGREKISGSMESRGLLHSGEHEQMLGRQRTLEEQQLNALQTAAADEVANLQNQLATRRVGLNNRRDELGLVSGVNQTVAGAI